MLLQVVPRTLLSNSLLAGLFGFVVPYFKGIEFLDLFLLLPYSFLSLFFVLPMTVDAVFASPNRGVPLGPVFRAAGGGWIAGFCLLALGVGTVSWRSGRLVAPPAAVALSLAVLSLFACLLAAAIAVWTANHTVDGATAKSRLRIGFLLALVLFFALPRVLSEDSTAALLGYLTPSGIAGATLVLAPISAIASVLILARLVRR
jgi:hypothetical protein